jgi:hypothetical protein
MSFLLSDKNVFNYLKNALILDDREIKNLISIEPKICKNFNLKIVVSESKQLLRLSRTYGDKFYLFK